jgi:O-acetylhomoserine (thiol)-lyase
MTDIKQGFNTKAIHAGSSPDPATGARATPIYQTASYVFENTDHASDLFAGKAFGNIYTRIMNPTQDVLEKRVAELEGGTAALAVASGHAAQFIALHPLLSPGNEFVASNKLYGGSINQFNHSFKKFDWKVRWADTNDIDSYKKSVNDKTRAIFIESIANPGGIITDIEPIARVAEDAGVPLIVDNTMATPVLCKPFNHGANIIIHSLTKFLGGQGNSVGGVIVDGGNFDWSKNDKFPDLSQPHPSYHGYKFHETFGEMGISYAVVCRFLALRDLGPAISPFNAFLILNGIETVPLRMKKHSENALEVAKFLKEHDKVSWVNYAGLEDSEYKSLANKYCPNGAGAVFTFGVKGGFDAGVKLVNEVQLFSHLANIGDTKSLIIHPSSTTHSQLTDDEQIAAGAAKDVVRLSVGIEDSEDIIGDLSQALEKV